MENSTRLQDEDEKENLDLRSQEVLKEEPQKKKKLVVFEIDNLNNAQNVYEVSNFKIEEIYCSQNKSFRKGDISCDDGLILKTPIHGEAKSCQLPFCSGDVSTMMFDEFGLDVIELQNRILELEKQLKNDNLELPPIFSDLKSQVENFRNKLETSERYRKQPFCQRFQYRRTSSERGRKIREKFLNICDKEISESTKDWLKKPSFDSSRYEDEEILLFLQHMFLELGFISKFDIRLPTLRSFLYEVYKNYNEVPFHNFRHCFCVAQMMYVIIWSVDIPKKMGDLETLILLTSCICHDLDHPGYNNIYQINARTELALLYNDISPLENHHCSVAFRILENPECNIFAPLDKETFKEIREGIIRCILATDMARHNEILTQFKDIIPDFDFGNKAHKNLLSMILIKVADISNEARPMSVAEPWLDRLLMEFFKQSDAEKREGLPVTPFMDREKITKPSSQCSFIGFVLLPLFEALGELLPELHDLIIAPAKYALDHYKRLNEAAKDERLRRKSVAETINSENYDESENAGMVKSGSGLSMKSRRSLSTCSQLQVRQRSKSTDEFEAEATPPSSPNAGVGIPEDLNDLDEREEIEEEDEEEEELDEEETVTEVEVSEKTLKFKISTECSATTFPGRRSCPGSRKGSKERNQYPENDVEWSRLMKDDDSRSLKRSITSETMSSRKGSSDSEKGRKNSGESVKDEYCRRSSRHKDLRPKNSYNKKKTEYRRKSLAVVERTRKWDHSKRRKSTSSTCEIISKEPLETNLGEDKESVKKNNDKPVLPKPEIGRTENRCSREFETSCWGLQNLKKNTLVFYNTPNIINKTLKNSLQQNVESEKSKSEDNLTIKDKARVSPVLGNNINVSKAEDSVDKLGLDSDRKKKLGSNGHLSLLTKLKHLKDRISFSRDSEDLTSSGPISAEKTGKPNADNQNTSKECEEDSEKSRTLPKTKKPHRTPGKMRKGWRALIGKSEGNSSSSLDVFPGAGSPSPNHPNPRRKSSMEEGKLRARNAELCFSSEKKKTTWLSSPKKVIFLSKTGRGNDENGKQNFLNNITSSFRKKGNKNDEENGASSSGSLQDGSQPN